MTFPDRKFAHACELADDYFEHYTAASASVNRDKLNESAALADVNLHVDGDNYGIIEDVHQGLMHILAQFVRQKHMGEIQVAERKF